MKRMIISNNKLEIFENLKKVYGWQNASSLENIFKKINKSEVDVLQTFFNDVFRKGWAAHEKHIDDEDEVAKGNK